MCFMIQEVCLFLEISKTFCITIENVLFNQLFCWEYFCKQHLEDYILFLNNKLFVLSFVVRYIFLITPGMEGGGPWMRNVSVVSSITKVIWVQFRLWWGALDTTLYLKLYLLKFVCDFRPVTGFSVYASSTKNQGWTQQGNHKFTITHFINGQNSGTIKGIPVNLWELLGGRSPPYQLF